MTRIQPHVVAKIYGDLLTAFAVHKRFRDHGDLMSPEMQILCDEEHKIFSEVLSITIHCSKFARDNMQSFENASEADCRFTWDRIMEMVVSTDLVVQRAWCPPLAVHA